MCGRAVGALEVPGEPQRAFRVFSRSAREPAGAAAAAAERTFAFTESASALAALEALDRRAVTVSSSAVHNEHTFMLKMGIASGYGQLHSTIPLLINTGIS